MTLTATVSCVLLFLAVAKASTDEEANLFPDGVMRFAKSKMCSRSGAGGSIDASTYTVKAHDCCYDEPTRDACCLQFDGVKETFKCMCTPNTVCKKPASSGENITGTAESLCYDSKQSRILGGKPVLNECTYAGIAQVLKNDGNFLCNAVYTILADGTKAFITPFECLPKYRTPEETGIKIELIISGETFPISYDGDTGPSMLTASKPADADADGFAYVKISDTAFNSHFSRLICNTPACMYKNTMRTNIDFTNCKMVSYSKIMINDQVIGDSSKPREAKASVNIWKCPDELDFSKQYVNLDKDKSTSLCFTLDSNAFYSAKDDGGAPVYCKAKSNNEDILIGVAMKFADDAAAPKISSEMRVLMTKA